MARELVISVLEQLMNGVISQTDEDEKKGRNPKELIRGGGERSHSYGTSFSCRAMLFLRVTF